MTIDKQALRNLALRATQSPWAMEHENIWYYENGYTKHLAYFCQGDDVDDHQDDANTRYVAAADPTTVLALLDELEAKDSTISTQQQEIRTLLNALEQATEKRNYDIPGHKRLIGWRASDYTDETSDPELAKNWAAAIGVLPIFEGDVNTKLSAAGIGKGE
ncbi:ead/Ea22-like family protein [Citrobacter amalonaticus]|uniref:ead/Ea22-like family protein n=1 Tax=Citrobacter amalonaticus TaxID=35703 RepID=UPI0018ABED9D|nr:ead/Ea22-like family protein [Citrobacter amalonaticus]